MASTSAEMPESSTKRTIPALGTRLHPNITFRDSVRIVLFPIIPIYARIYLFSSIWITFGHVYVISTTCICIIYFSKGMISLRSVWDIIYGLLVSSFPSWGASILQIIWDESKIQGWRWEVVYWTWVAIQLSYLLPEYYGSDVQPSPKFRKDRATRFMAAYGVVYESVNTWGMDSMAYNW
ncbi:uncharacterized protein TrAtP1_007602 [Trichoderma atroviride]|uniref:uncharacterized protein n=1 Tax=Hypocrea atroviridis TaxID=63577 RepID=UPI0033266C7E|nr:hypothetical protein TrAtP1_007602 [Trichoderma atroviride]